MLTCLIDMVAVVTMFFATIIENTNAIICCGVLVIMCELRYISDK